MRKLEVEILKHYIPQALYNILSKYPFFFSLFPYLKIYYDERKNVIAGMNHKFELVIGKKIFDFFERVYNLKDSVRRIGDGNIFYISLFLKYLSVVLAHEFLHGLLLHIYTFADIGKSKSELDLLNTAMDAVVNETLKILGILNDNLLESNLITMDDIVSMLYGEVKKEDLMKMSAEQIYELLVKKKERVREKLEELFKKVGEPGIFWDLFSQSEGGKKEKGFPIGREGEKKDKELPVVYQGELANLDNNNQRRDQEINNAIFYSFQKLYDQISRIIENDRRAGTMPGDLEELIRVYDVRTKILNKIGSLVYGWGNKGVSRSYTVVNKVDEEKAGWRKTTYPPLLSIVDVSGSMPSWEISLLLGILKNYPGEVYLITFSDKITDVKIYRSGKNIPREIEIVGRGGTILTVFEELLKPYKSQFKESLIKVLQGIRKGYYLFIGSDFEIANNPIDSIINFFKWFGKVIEVILVSSTGKFGPFENFNLGWVKINKFTLPTKRSIYDIVKGV